MKFDHVINDSVQFISVFLITLLSVASANAQSDSIRTPSSEKTIFGGKLSIRIPEKTHRISKKQLKVFQPEAKVLAREGFSLPDGSRMLYYYIDVDWDATEEWRVEIWRRAFEIASSFSSFEFVEHGFFESITTSFTYYMKARAIVDNNNVLLQLTFSELEKKVLYTLLLSGQGG